MSSYEKALYTTWNISLEYIQARNILAVKLLRLWAYFDHQDLWYELLVVGNVEGLEWFSELVEDELNFNAAIRLLCDHALVERLSDSNGYGMHICVHAWVIHVLNAEKDPAMARLALLCVGQSVPHQNNTKNWTIGRRLLSHARQCWMNIDGTDFEVGDDENTLHAVFCLGKIHKYQGNLKEAEKMYMRALTGQEKVLGAEHIRTLCTINDLGLLYIDQNKLQEAEEMLLRVTTECEYFWGAEHTQTLDTINSLGICYLGQQKLKKAEQMFLRALIGREKALGAEHITTLNIINNLGICYEDQKKLEKAERMFLRALKGYDKACNTETPLLPMFNTMSNLGALYAGQSNWGKVEEMCSRALKGYERVYGPEHKRSLYTRYNLAVTYRKLSMFEDAAKHFELVVQGYTNQLGPEHLDTIDALNCLEEVTYMSSKAKMSLPLRSNH